MLSYISIFIYMPTYISMFILFILFRAYIFLIPFNYYQPVWVQTVIFAFRDTNEKRNVVAKDYDLLTINLYLLALYLSLVAMDLQLVGCFRSVFSGHESELFTTRDMCLIIIVFI